PRLDEPEDAEGEQDGRGDHAQRARVGDDLESDDERRDERDRHLVPDGDRHERAQHGAPAALLHAPRHGEQPAHGRVDAVVGAEPDQGQPRRAVAHDGKQYESLEASPPWRRTWWGRSPAYSTKKSGSTAMSPLLSSLTIQPSMPSGENCAATLAYSRVVR